MAYKNIVSVVSLDDDFIMDLFASVCYDSVFGLSPYLEDDVYDKVREQIEHRFSDDTLCVENVWLEALKQGILKAYDTEDDESYDLTLEMLKKGLEIYLNLEYTNHDLESMDAIDWANLLQCAIFEDVIYG